MPTLSCSMCLLILDWFLANSCGFLVVVHISAADTDSVSPLLVDTGNKRDPEGLQLGGVVLGQGGGHPLQVAEVLGDTCHGAGACHVGLLMGGCGRSARRGGHSLLLGRAWLDRCRWSRGGLANIGAAVKAAEAIVPAVGVGQPGAPAGGGAAPALLQGQQGHHRAAPLPGGQGLAGGALVTRMGAAHCSSGRRATGREGGHPMGAGPLGGAGGPGETGGSSGTPAAARASWRSLLCLSKGAGLLDPPELLVGGRHGHQ